MAAERSLDIFKLLSELNKKKLDIWESLSEDERKGFAPMVVMRWMSGVDDARQIIYLNELINPILFTVGKHPGLLMKLLAICASGQPRRYQWMKQQSSLKVSKKKVSVKVIHETYRCGDRCAIDYLELVTGEDVIQMAEALGYQKDEISLIKKEWK